MLSSIHTPRLSLNPLAIADSDFIFELTNSPGWIQFIGDRNIKTGDDATAYIQKITNDPNVQYWVVATAGNGTPVGVITLIKRDYLEHHDIGFAFLPRYAGMGYAFEAAKSVLDALAENSAHSHILATTLPDNIRSIRLLEKLGLRFDKALENNDLLLHVYAKALKPG